MGSIKVIFNDNMLENLNFEIHFSKCASEKCLKNKLRETGNRVCYSLHFINQGMGFLGCGNEKIVLKKGDLFMIYPKSDNVYYPDQNSPWRYTWIDFYGENLDLLMLSCGFSKEKPYMARREERYNILFSQLFKAFSSTTNNSIECSSLFLSIIFSLACDFKNLKGQGKENISAPKNLLREAIIFINCNYKMDLALIDIASAVNVSKSYLINLFSGILNISPMRYLMLYRIANACEILKQDKKSIQQISVEVGFNDPLYFSRCFSSVKKVSPKAYRQNVNENPWQFLQEKGIDYR